MLRVVPGGIWWHVERNGTTVSTHREKDEAVKEANRLASSGEEVVTHRLNGTIQERRTRR